jgi:peptidoglycan/LPS O-acetylase OafA/YrhL
MLTKTIDTAKSTQPNIDELTSLRFLAAFAVVLSHLTFLAANPDTVAANVYTNFFSQGFCGVSFFYVLSGFIISHAYQAKLLSGATSRLEYMLLRVARIAPMHLLLALLFLTWVAVIKRAEPEPLTWFLNLTLLQSWSTDPNTYYSLNAPSWSLSNEMFFYLAFIFLVTLSTRSLACIAAVSATTLIGLATWFVRQPDMLPITEWVFYVNPVTRLLEFIVGMLMFRARQADVLHSFASTKSEVALLASIPVLMFGLVILGVPLPFRWQLAYLPAMALTVLVFSYGQGSVSRLLRNRTAVLLGQASFSLYLLHRPLITFAHQASEKFLDSRYDVPLAVTLVVVSVIGSLFAFRLIEQPIHAKLRSAIQRFVSTDRVAETPARERA